MQCIYVSHITFTDWFSGGNTLCSLWGTVWNLTCVKHTYLLDIYGRKYGTGTGVFFKCFGFPLWVSFIQYCYLSSFQYSSYQKNKTAKSGNLQTKQHLLWYRGRIWKKIPAHCFSSLQSVKQVLPFATDVVVSYYLQLIFLPISSFPITLSFCVNDYRIITPLAVASFPFLCVSASILLSFWQHD
jgi:hypothetical protein